MMAAIFVIIPAFSTFAQSTTRKEKKDYSLQNENRLLRQQIDSLQKALDEALSNHAAVSAKLEASHAEQRPQPGHGTPTFTLGDDAKDSISLWEAQALVAKEKQPEFNLDSVKLASSVSDDIYHQRLKEMNNIFTLPYNDIVRNYMVLYSERMKTRMETILGLCSYYYPYFYEIFNKYGIPEELVNLTIIESALNPMAMSYVGARGMWQFMYVTGKEYGLEINSYIDERCDPYKAADAAARLLSNSYKKFGDWALVISAYNCGPGNVDRAIMRAGGKRDYWSIYPYLPTETRGYAPAFVGALYAVNYYKEHGIKPKPAALPEKVDTFQIKKKLHFQQINSLVGVPISELRNLNPQYVHDIIPGGKTYILRIPAQYTESFIEHEDSIYVHMADSLFNPTIVKKIEAAGNGSKGSGGGRVSYKVKSGDTLGKIASKYHVSVDQIKKWNGLKNTNIRVGQTLYIYGSGGSSYSSSSSSSSKTTSSSSSSSSSGSYTYYTVKSGDTLYSISQKYARVSVADIQKANGIGTNIKPGQKLKIPNK